MVVANWWDIEPVVRHRELKSPGPEFDHIKDRSLKGTRRRDLVKLAPVIAAIVPMTVGVDGPGLKEVIGGLLSISIRGVDFQLHLEINIEKPKVFSAPGRECTRCGA